MDKKFTGLCFANLNDFDCLYGHRRDVAGYRKALEDVDARLPELFSAMKPTDLLILLADHGNDPAYHGTDHTREYIPFIAYNKKMPVESIGIRKSFADIGQTITHVFSGKPKCLSIGTSIFSETI